MGLKFRLRASVAVLATFGAISPGTAEIIRVKVDKLTFSPNQVLAHAGDTIEWVSADFVAHTATARNGSWDAIVPAGKSKSVVLTQAGTIDYYCRFHPNMTGRIVVTAKE